MSLIKKKPHRQKQKWKLLQALAGQPRAVDLACLGADLHRSDVPAIRRVPADNQGSQHNERDGDAEVHHTMLALILSPVWDCRESTEKGVVQTMLRGREPVS